MLNLHFPQKKIYLKKNQIYFLISFLVFFKKNTKYTFSKQQQKKFDQYYNQKKVLKKSHKITINYNKFYIKKGRSIKR